MEIKYEEQNQRAVAYDGEKEIGESTHSSSDAIWIIDHTVVDEAYGGKGIARKLVDTVVDEARKRDVKLMATCPYALKLFKTDPQYEDVFLG